MQAARDQPQRPHGKPSTRLFTNHAHGPETTKMSLFSSVGKKVPISSGASLVCLALAGCVIPPTRWEEKL